jgi:hypothetical protein
MTEEFKAKINPFGFSDDTMELLQRFFSILLTALISALITFLQSVVADPSLAPVIQEQVPQAGATGAILRSIVLLWAHRATMG